jgi:hypothetical protein
VGKRVCYGIALASARPFSLEGFDSQFIQRPIKVSAGPCELHNDSNRGSERDLIGGAKAGRGTQLAVNTQDRLYDPDADAPLQTQALA